MKSKIQFLLLVDDAHLLILANCSWGKGSTMLHGKKKKDLKSLMGQLN